MTQSDITKIQAALSEGLNKVVGVPVEGEARAAKFALPFLDRNGQVFTLFVYQRKKAKKFYLTDAGAIVQTLRKSGLEVQLDLLQKVLTAYGLVVLDNGSIVEQSDRPLWQRVLAVFQGLVMADGILRTWTLPKPK